MSDFAHPSQFDERNVSNVLPALNAAGIEDGIVSRPKPFKKMPSVRYTFDNLPIHILHQFSTAPLSPFFAPILYLFQYNILRKLYRG